MANPNPSPWAPDPDNPIGTPPSTGFPTGTGGERGTAAWEGDADWDENMVPTDPTAPTIGPGTGVSYHATENPVVTDAWGFDPAREDDGVPVPPPPGP